RSSLENDRADILATTSNISILGAYIHPFFLTYNFVVLAVWTSHFPGKGAPILWHQSVLDAIAHFNPKTQVQWLEFYCRYDRGVIAMFDSPSA
ncbi:hypothetical protein BJ878DRAFT_389489, partial [Calycina marina]